MFRVFLCLVIFVLGGCSESVRCRDVSSHKIGQTFAENSATSYLVITLDDAEAIGIMKYTPGDLHPSNEYVKIVCVRPSGCVLMHFRRNSQGEMEAGRQQVVTSTASIIAFIRDRLGH